ncbi:MAG TPA: aspartate/glutamate racemase family protein [Methylomirabilota bacterium]|nr:aspartate/glutamate racemase family protein [Methylomirabilota bacterium]
MKTIGLLGGLSWESSAEYYRIINELTREKLGGLHSAKSLMYTFDFHEIEELQHKGDWKQATKLLIEAAKNLESGKADFLLICSNTMHKMAEDVEKSVNIPLLHIADGTAEKIVAQGIKNVGLLGTAFTMEQDFYKGRLSAKYGLDVVIPEKADRKIVHDIIYNELCVGKINQSSKEEYIRIMKDLVDKGAQGIILGCTEITLLVTQKDSSVPLFDTTAIHAQAAVEYALI